MIDSVQQRHNMVESQIRPSDVTDRRILRAMADVARERFVPTAFASLAYMDEPVPLQSPAKPGSATRTLMPPRTFAKLVQLAAIEPTDSVLVVGAGLGYSVAVIARMAAHVTGLECDPTLADAARSALSDLENVAIETGPLVVGPAGSSVFNVIVVEGAVWEQPSPLAARLAPGGRLIAVLTPPGGGVGQATVWTRVGDHLAVQPAFDSSAMTLPGFERPRSFAL